MVVSWGVGVGGGAKCWHEPAVGAGQHGWVLEGLG